MLLFLTMEITMCNTLSHGMYTHIPSNAQDKLLSDVRQYITIAQLQTSGKGNPKSGGHSDPSLSLVRGPSSALPKCCGVLELCQ